MILINAAQVEWLVINQPETAVKIFYEGEFIDCAHFTNIDTYLSSEEDLKYYLTPETYNALPQEFKDLA